MTEHSNKYLLDTDVIIWILRGDQKIIKAISDTAQRADMCISVITTAEIYKNIFPSELQTTESLLSSHLIFPITNVVAKQAGLYWQEYHKKFKKLSLTDCLIASTALVQETTLITLNTKHFPMQNISVRDSKDL